MIEKQISSQYSQALNSITKKEILDQIEKNHQVDLPQNLIDQEISIMTQNLKPEEKEKHKSKNEKLAKSRIKMGLLLNEYGEKNNLKVSDDEVRNEIQKQIKRHAWARKNGNGILSKKSKCISKFKRFFI